MSSVEDPIKSYFEEQSQIIYTLNEQREFSLAQTAQNIFAKSLVLIAASVFETQLREIVVNAISARTNSDSYVLSFCRRKGMDRQYHTWFDWEAKNANSFFKLFGPEADTTAKRIADNDEEVKRSIEDFIFIGKTRNEIMHLNFLTFPFNDPPDVVLSRIQSARGVLKLAKQVLHPPIPISSPS